MPTTIEIRRRSDDFDDFHAQIEDKPKIWGCGKTPGAALGDLLWAHAEHFGVKIVPLCPHSGVAKEA